MHFERKKNGDSLKFCCSSNEDRLCEANSIYKNGQVFFSNCNIPLQIILVLPSPESTYCTLSLDAIPYLQNFMAANRVISNDLLEE